MGGFLRLEVHVDAEPERSSFFDTLTGIDLDEGDRLLHALDFLGEALAGRGAAIEELKKQSDRPPPPTPLAT